MKNKEVLSVNHYTNLNLKYNPFSYLNDRELFLVTIERIDLENLKAEMDTKSSFFIEFYGKKGRGKSTHLQVLYYKYFKDAVFYKLHKANKYTIVPTPKVLIIDSFQLLSLKNRIQLLNTQKKLIVSAHYSHSFLRATTGLKKKISFSALHLDVATLERIIILKLRLARLDAGIALPKLKYAYLEQLIIKYNNNLRGIQLELYHQFLKPNPDVYEL